MDKAFFEKVRRGWLVLTVNKRLSRALHAEFDDLMRQNGHRAWHRPAILPFEAWLDDQLKRCGPGESVLSDLQARHLWEELIRDDLSTAAFPAFQLSATARKAYGAERLLIQFGLQSRTGPGGTDHAAFLRWRSAWQALLAERGWVDGADAPWRVAQALESGRLTAPDQLILAGFDDLTPDIKQVRSALRRRGCEVEIWLAEISRDPAIMTVKCDDMTDEVDRCARWARRLLLNGEKRIGIVAPDLESYRALIGPSLRAEFVPDALLACRDEPDPFNLSLGDRLATEGVVRAALRLLHLGPKLRFDEISWLLRSPYLGGAQQECSARAEAERALRECGQTSWLLARLVRWFEQRQGLTRLVALLKAVRKGVTAPERQQPGCWAEQFASTLSECGWPGERSPDSREYQAIQHFREALGQLASLDRVQNASSRAVALAILASHAGETVFQPKTPDHGVQILGLLETAGLRFDHLWILGMHDQALPAPPRPNPFLPLSLQREHGMPHADADRERLFADRVAERLLGAAPDVVVSYPGQIDGAAQRPSPYLSGLPEGLPELAESAGPSRYLNRHAPQLEQLSDDRCAPLNSRKPFSGGTAILKDQGLCPFRAYAHHRLRARGLECPDVGIDSMGRGSLVHAVLEIFWKEVGSQERLLGLGADEERRRLTAAAGQALEIFERQRRADLPRHLRRIEATRLVALCSEWLQVERSRTPFAIDELETLHHVEIGRLRIRTRIDRIDLLSGGRRAVIDYKTVRPDPADWVGARVTEPQLPIYCLDRESRVLDTVAFAVVRSGECRFRGFSREPEGFPGLSARGQERLLGEQGWSTLDDVLNCWQEAIPALGDAFAEGRAAVDPVDERRACRYCDLHPFCRIHEQAPQREMADDP